MGPQRLLGLAVAAAFLVTFGPTLAHLLSDWAHSAEYGHGFLLSPIALWIAWRNRRPAAEPAPGSGLALLVGAALLFLLGTAAAEFFTQRLAVWAALAGLSLYYLGWSQLRAWWLPFALLLFTIPLPEVILNTVTLPLQLIASRIAVTLLEFRHVPVELSGNIIRLPNHELFVAEACSGLRSLSALLGLSLLFGGTSLSRPLSRIGLLVIAVPAALAANALRVFGTGYAVYYISPRLAEGAGHELTGVAVFFLALGIVAASMVSIRGWERWLARRSTSRHTAERSA